MIRGSAFGKCDLALARIAAGMEGEPFPQATRDAMDWGVENEPVVIGMLPQQGWEAVDDLTGFGLVDESGQLCLELKVGKVKIRLHPDGVARWVGEQGRMDATERVLEVKCMAEGNDPQKNGMYDWQFSLEMAATGLPLLLAIGWKVPDAENGVVRVLDRVEIREIDTPPYTIGEIKRRALALSKMFDAAIEGRWDDVGGCDESMYPCPFYNMHEGKPFVEIVDAVVVGEAEAIIGKIVELKERERDGKVASDARKILEAELAQTVGGWGFAGKVGGWKISVVESQIEESTRTVKAHVRRAVKIDQMKETN